MNLKIKHKLLLLIFIPLTISFITIILIYNNSLKNHFQNIALQDTDSKLMVFEDRLGTLRNSLQNHTQRIADDESIVSSLNLIVNYENPQDYRYLIFDNEKRKLLSNYSSFSTNKYLFSVGFYDTDMGLIAYSEHDNGVDRSLISSYTTTGEKIYLDDENQKTKVQKHIKKLDYKQQSYQMHNDMLHIQSVFPVYRGDQIIAHVKATIKIDKERFFSLISDIDRNFFLLSQDTAFIYEQKLKEVTFSDLVQKDSGLITTEDFIYNFTTICKEYARQPIYAVATLSQQALNDDLGFLKYQIVSVLVFVFFILLGLITFFTNTYILRPLDVLLQSIDQLKNKKFQTIPINNDDELGEIASRFNELSKELGESIHKLQSTNLLLQNILDTAPMRIFIKDTQGKYIKANSYFLSDCGLDDEKQLVNKSDHDLPWSKDEIAAFTADDKDVLEEKKILIKKEQTQTRVNGEKITVLKSKVALKDSNGKVIGLLGIYDDITKQKEVKKELQQKERYLLHQSRLAQMGEMINMIAHQWRQPLAAISSTANALSLKLAMGKYNEKFFETRLDNINDYSQHLSATIDDFRNFFKKNKEKKEVTLEQLVDDSLNIISTSLQNKSIVVKKEYNCNRSFYTYSNEVRQVILNLLKNAEDALVETQAQTKWIKITTTYEDGKHLLSVEDSGGGIKDEAMDKLFEPYFSTKAGKDGTGLGLYMSKTIMEDHCLGRLSASNSDSGAIFKVEL